MSKGWYNGVTVELENGCRYSVFFYDPVRLAQDLQLEVEAIEKGWGKSYIAEAGMIVVPEINEANIRSAIQGLYNEGWFNNLQPIQKSS